MTDETTPQSSEAGPTGAQPAQPAQDATPAASGEATAAAAPASDTDAQTPDIVIGLVTDGAHSLIVAQFRTMDEAQSAYEQLREIERTSSLQIDGVVVASCDAEGKVHLGKATEHSTRTGLRWGVVGGALLGLVFPPSIIGSAVAAGGLGAVLGKVRNVFHRSGIADELAGVMKPNTAAIIALVQDTAVVEIQKALAQAQDIVTRAVDKQVAAEIDREAAMAKESLTTG
jgi:uncharacterized membrane protein